MVDTDGGGLVDYREFFIWIAETPAEGHLLDESDEDYDDEDEDDEDDMEVGTGEWSGGNKTKDSSFPAFVTRLYKPRTPATPPHKPETKGFGTTAYLSNRASMSEEA